MSARDALPTGLALGGHHLKRTRARYPLAAVAALALLYYVTKR